MEPRLSPWRAAAIIVKLTSKPSSIFIVTHQPGLTPTATFSASVQRRLPRLVRRCSCSIELSARKREAGLVQSPIETEPSSLKHSSDLLSQNEFAG